MSEGNLFSIDTVDQLLKNVQDQLIENTGGNDPKSVSPLSSDTVLIANGDSKIASSVVTATELTTAIDHTSLTSNPHSTTFDQAISAGSVDASDGNILVGNNSSFVVENGATLRSSIGVGVSDDVTFNSVAINGNIAGSLKLLYNNPSSTNYELSIVQTSSNQLTIGSDINLTEQTALTSGLTQISHTSPGTPDYAIQDLTDTSPFGFATKDEGNTVLSVIKNLQIRIAELESKLQSIGIIA